jgi:hypothetical protein
LLAGDFSGLAPLIDPTTGTPFPNNQVPAQRINAVAKNLFPFFATPNRASTAPGGLETNYLVNVRSKQNNHRYQGRVDYSLDSSNSLFVRYLYVDRYNQTPGITEKRGRTSSR